MSDAAAVPGRGPLAELLAPVRGRLVLGTAAQALAAACSLVPFAAIYLLALELTGARDRGTIGAVLLFAGGGLLARFVLQSVSTLLLHDADMTFQLAVRRRIADRLRLVPLGWFRRNNSATVKKVLADDIESMHYLVAHAAPDLTSAVVAPVLSLAVLFVLDWRLTLLSLVTLPVFAVLYRVLTGRGENRMQRLGAAVVAVTAAVISYIQGITVIRVFGRRGAAGERFSAAVDDYMRTFVDANGPLLRLNSVAFALVSPAAMLTTAVGAGVLGTALGWVSAPTVLAFVLFAVAVTSPFGVITHGPQAFAAARGAAARVLDVLATPVLEQPRAGVVPDGAEVRFEGVTFGHRPDHPVLHDVDAVLPVGGITALVGPSGSGKSTLASLLPRFADPQQGRITLGGVDVRDMVTEELYRHVSFVFQDAGLLRTSVLENLRLAVPTATVDQVREAARRARCDHEVMAFPRGYESVVGRDVTPSGGQAQRLAVARAILADTPVLVLDEATAYADPATEARLCESISELIVGRTVLVIAHRLPTIVDADQILVLDRGRIAQRGRFEELVDEPGPFRDAWHSYRLDRSSAGTAVRR